MTMREFYAAIVEGSVITAEMAEFAQAQIEKINDRNERRKSYPSRNRSTANSPANLALKDTILKFLMTAEDFLPASEIAKSISTEENTYTTAKVAAMLRQLAENNEVLVQEGATSKKPKTYKIAA